ncbi:MAG TPA: LCP family protein [Streptosporangiaceae bacterium]|nr:LCP family protein [Streptosporangiaceae bacterium]
MNEWPAGWYRDEPTQPGTAGNQAGRAASEPTVNLPSGGSKPAGYSPSSDVEGVTARMTSGPGKPDSRSAATQAWPSQPPRQSSRVYQPSPTGPSGGGTFGLRPRRPRWRMILALLAALVAVALILATFGYFYLDSKLTRSNILVDYSGRPAAGSGQNWLITGSDSRQGLTRRQERRLHTGPLSAAAGQRSDTILLLHIPANGNPPVLVSLPRDSYVDIPGNGMNKINAAFDLGGPKLLAETVQNATGLQIEHYMGIGFGGLVNVVDAVGGVTMCFPHSIRDSASGLHLRKGCDNLSGAKALAFVRTRHEFLTQDLQREENQRLFIKALLTKVTSPGVMFNPFSAWPAATGAAGSLTVDQGTHLYQLMQVAFALKNPETTTVPIGNANLLTNVGDAVQWDRPRALRFFNDLNTDTPLPKSLVTGSKLQG